MAQTAVEIESNEIANFDTDIAKFTSRQQQAIDELDSGLIKFLLYGGALGGGKSYFLRWNSPRHLIKLYHNYGVTGVPAMIACEDYPSLKDRQLSKISREFPAWLGKPYQDHRDWGRCYILHDHLGGGVICFRNLDDPSKYASAEFALIEVDELTKNPFEIFDHLRTRLRWPGVPDMECQFVAGSNPGSKGHGWVKAFWMDKIFPEEWRNPIDFTKMFAYVPSLADDNPHLDSAYWAMLNTLPLNLRKAFRYGDWNVFLGQAFPEFMRETHVIKPLPVPDNAPVYMGMDWGFGAPFSIGWYWTDMDARLYRFAEWYGWNSLPNQGIRLADTDMALGIIEREKAMGIWRDEQDTRSPIVRIANPDAFNKKPDYNGGGQGPATAEVLARHRIFLMRGDPSRALKIRQFRERLRIPKNAKGEQIDRPLLLVYDTCEQFIRTIPNLIQDENNIEDVDTSSEDHIYDETAVICMARPIAMAGPPPRKLTMFEKDMMHITGVDPREEDGHSRPTQAQVWVDDQEEHYEADKYGRWR